MLRTLVLLMSLAALAACSDMGGGPSASGSCANEVRQVKASADIQGGGKHQTAGRDAAQTYLQQASAAAARGDEVTCRRNLDQARLSLTY